MTPHIHKVNYYETDKMGVTHHSNYVRFMEEARIHFLDEIGYSYARLEKEGIISPVVGIECNYVKTTTFDDVIAIDVVVEKLSPCKLTFGYTFKVGEEVVFKATSSHCFIDANGAPVIMVKTYPEMFAKLKEFEVKA